MQSLFHWMTANPLAGAGLVFGGAVVAVVLYSYVFDYRMLLDRK